MSTISSESQPNQPKRKVIIFDTTLRDGEQCPGASMSVEQKVEIARKLDEAGVDVIEAGFAASSPKDFDSIRQICRNTYRATICSLSRCVPSDIEESAEALKPAILQGRGRIHVFCATSDIHMEHKLQKTPTEVLQMIQKGVSHAKKFTQDVQFSAEDASRSNRDFLTQAIQVAIRSGATTINLPDTVGYATPEEYQEFMSDMIQRVGNPKGIVFSAHCHDDLGNATANSLAAVKGGAGQVEGTINGIGERAGNTAIEEMIANIMVRPDRYPYDTGIDSTFLTPLSTIVAEYSFPIARNKAVVGPNAFAHGSGIHQHGVLGKTQTYNIMSPESVGQKVTLPITSHSGQAAVLAVLKEQGMRVEGMDVRGLMGAIKKLGEAHKIIPHDLITQCAERFTSRGNCPVHC